MTNTNVRLLYLRIFSTTYEKAIGFENRDLNFVGNRKFRYVEGDSSFNGIIKEEESEEYFDNLYEGINACCLVGKNGSGKTTLLYFLQWLLSIPEILNVNHYYSKISWEFVAIVEVGREIRLLHNTNPIENSPKLELLNLKEKYLKEQINPNKGIAPIPSETIFYSPHMEFENPPSFVPGDFLDVSTNRIYYDDLSERENNDGQNEISYFRKEEIKRQIKFINHNTRSKKRSITSKELSFLETFIGNTIYLEFKSDIKRHRDFRYLSFENIELYEKIDHAYISHRNNIYDRLKNSNVKAKERNNNEYELAYWFLFKRVVELVFDNAEIYYSRYPKGTKQARHDIIDNNKIDLSKPIKDILDDFLGHQNFVEDKKVIRFKRGLSKFSELISKRSFIYLSVSITNEQSFRCDLSAGRDFINLENELLLGFDDSIYSVDWPGLSTGERAYLNLFSRLYTAFRLINKKDKKKSKSLFFLVDEPATGFHPQWQKEYFNKLISYLKWEFEWPQINLIIATHSPYVLTNFQKSDVIALSGDYNDQMTFGANIHELLANQFFLQDGFIGDFAKAKIIELMDFLASDDLQNQKFDLFSAQKLIKNIGEPLIRQRMQDLYDQKFDESKELSGFSTEQLQAELRNRNEKDSDK